MSKIFVGVDVSLILDGEKYDTKYFYAILITLLFSFKYK